MSPVARNPVNVRSHDAKRLRWPESLVSDVHLMFTCREAEESSRARGPDRMRSFKESEKSQKTVKSMIETKGGEKVKEPGGKKNKNTKKEGKCFF